MTSRLSGADCAARMTQGSRVDWWPLAKVLMSITTAILQVRWCWKTVPQLCCPPVLLCWCYIPVPSPPFPSYGVVLVNEETLTCWCLCGLPGRHGDCVCRTVDANFLTGSAIAWHSGHRCVLSKLACFHVVDHQTCKKKIRYKTIREIIVHCTAFERIRVSSRGHWFGSKTKFVNVTSSKNYHFGINIWHQTKDYKGPSEINIFIARIPAPGGTLTHG